MPGPFGEDEPLAARASGLSAFQLEVAQLFFSLPASRGFLLAGGAALLAQHLTSRPTDDLDFFTAPERGHVPAATRRAGGRCPAARLERRADPGQRHILPPDHQKRHRREMLADLAVDAPPDHPGSVTIAGPTFDPEELAGRKLLALFDRAAARDFVDVYLLAQRFPKDLLLARAAEVDAGFDTLVLAEMIATLARFTDADMPLPGESVPALRAFCEDWHSELTA